MKIFPKKPLSGGVGFVGAEFPAHGASFMVRPARAGANLPGECGVKGHFYLLTPIAPLSGAAHLFIPLPGTGPAANQVSRMRGDAGGQDPQADIMLIRQAKMFR